MRTYLRLFVFSAVLTLVLGLMSTGSGRGILFAHPQAGGTSPKGTSSGQATDSNGAQYGNQSSGGYQQGSGTNPSTGAQQPGNTGTPATDTSASRNDTANAETARAGTPWGRMLLSFIVGVIVGGLLFNRRRPPIQRDRDIRRAA
jgi:hypothetical protein